MKWKTTTCLLMTACMGQKDGILHPFGGSISSAIRNLIDPTLPIIIDDQPFAPDLNHFADKNMIHGPVPNFSSCAPVKEFWSTFGQRMGAKSLAELKSKNPNPAGKGNFGEVIRCGSSEAPLAFKLTRFKKDSSEAITINTEMSMYKRIGKHHYIAQGLGCYVLGDHGGMLMEALGEPLNKKMEFIHGLDTRGRAEIYMRIAHGYHYIHKKRICHNDIKPDNILQSSKNEKIFKIIDMGISCDMDQPCGIGFTPFAAPEKFRPFICQPSADVWAYALTIYCMETKQPDFLLPQRLVGCPQANTPKCLHMLTEKIKGELANTSNPFLILVRKVISAPPAQRNSMGVILRYLNIIGGGGRPSEGALPHQRRSSGNQKRFSTSSQNHHRRSSGQMGHLKRKSFPVKIDQNAKKQKV